MSDLKSNQTTNNNNNNTTDGKSNNNDEKQTEVGSGPSQEFRQIHLNPQPSSSVPLPHELTAEWTVRAQLTFARAGEKIQREFSSNDPVNPVRVVYKWSTVDSTSNPDCEFDERSSTNIHKCHSFDRASRQSTPLKHTASGTRHHPESFRSTTSSTNVDYGGGDSAFGSSTSPKHHKYKQQHQHHQPRSASSTANDEERSGAGGGPSGIGSATASLYGTRCRSTCNIVVSAVADFLSPDAVAAAAAAAANDNFMTANATRTASTISATDFIAEEEPDPFVYNTTASYTVLPQKSIDESSNATSASKNFTSFGKILALRDAFSQTSDTETKYFEERQRYPNSRSPIEPQSAYDEQQKSLLQLHHRYKPRQQQQQQEQLEQPLQRKPYEHRRATSEAVLQSAHSKADSSLYVDEGNSFMPSFTPSPTQTFKSASLPRIPPLPGQAHQYQPQRKTSAGDSQKKPRTVHIDVYCTGSEDEDQADGEASSSSSEDETAKRHDIDSNSTPQTVFDNEEMHLRHKLITGQGLPRRLQQSQPNQQDKLQQQQQSHQHTEQPQHGLNLGHAITKSSTAEEVSESKQMLFRKHIGDQRAAKLLTLRQKYIRQPSDDALSTGYPSSSRSTVREATCSSISSMVASSQADCAESSWKENEDAEDMPYSLVKSESFEYENSTDRYRIRQMENLWSSSSNNNNFSNDSNGHADSSSPANINIPPNYLHSISEVNSQRSSPFATPYKSNEIENFSETEMFYTYPGRGGALLHYQHELSNAPLSASQSVNPPFLQQTSHFPRNRPGFLQFFGPSVTQSTQNDAATLAQPTIQTSANTQSQASNLESTPTHGLYTGYQPHLERWKSECRDNLSTRVVTPNVDDSQSQHISPQPLTQRTLPYRCGSEAPASTTSASTFQSPIVARRFELTPSKRDSPSASEASTIIRGYTPEHLQKAHKFGKVVSTARKPGHHVGPTKNPNCSCESCSRWMAERFQLRGRAFSLGEQPILKRPIKK